MRREPDVLTSGRCFVQNIETQTEKIGVSEKSCKKTDFDIILFGLKLAFGFHSFTNWCRISSRIAWYKKVHIPKIPKTTRF